MASAADDAFAAIAARLTQRDGVAVGAGRGFGNGSLQWHGKIFAMVSRDRLVVKLPTTRVRDLLASGAGLEFDAGKGRPMREWVVVVVDAEADAQALAEEALEFVAGVA